MAIEGKKIGISALVGVLDTVAEDQDLKNGRIEPFRNMADIGRLVGTGLGLAMQVWMPRQAAVGESLANSSLTLLVKSLAKPIKGMITLPASRRTYVPRRAAAPTQASAHISRSAQEEFDKAQAF